MVVEFVVVVVVWQIHSKDGFVGVPLSMDFEVVVVAWHDNDISMDVLSANTSCGTLDTNKGHSLDT